jgi:hypothetical protein
MSVTRYAARVFLAALVAAAAGAAPGCAKKGNRLPVYPARGQVLVGGKPAKGVFVYLWPASTAGVDAYCPTGQTDENGTFTLSTYDPGDGAPEGEYAVTADWPVRFNPISNRWEGDQLKGRFADPKGSKVRATISPGPNELPPIRLDN